MNVLIVEDEDRLAGQMAMQIKGILGENTKVLGPYAESKKVLPHIKSCEIDLAVLDVQLQNDRYAGIHIGETVEALCNTPIIFVTGLSDEAIIERTKKINNCFYLKKPFDLPSFERALKGITLISGSASDGTETFRMSFWPRNRDKFWVKRGKSEEIGFEVGDVIWVEVKGRYCYFTEYTQQRDIIIKRALTDLYESILSLYGDTFYRISRGVVVNTYYITSVLANSVCIKAPGTDQHKEFAISKDTRDRLLELLRNRGGQGG